jgi:hypothetical protein
MSAHLPTAKSEADPKKHVACEDARRRKLTGRGIVLPSLMVDCSELQSGWTIRQSARTGQCSQILLKEL